MEGVMAVCPGQAGGVSNPTPLPAPPHLICRDIIFPGQLNGRCNSRVSRPVYIVAGGGGWGLQTYLPGPPSPCLRPLWHIEAMSHSWGIGQLCGSYHLLAGTNGRCNSSVSRLVYIETTKQHVRLYSTGLSLVVTWIYSSHWKTMFPVFTFSVSVFFFFFFFFFYY